MITPGSMDCSIYSIHFVGKSQCFIIVKSFQSCFQLGNQKGIMKLKFESLNLRFQISALLSAIFPLFCGAASIFSIFSFYDQICTAVTGWACMCVHSLPPSHACCKAMRFLMGFENSLHICMKLDASSLHLGFSPLWLGTVLCTKSCKGCVRSTMHSSIFTGLNHGSSHKAVTSVYRAKLYELYILLYDCLKTILY